MSDYSRIGNNLARGFILLLVLILTINTILAAVEITPAEIVLNVDYSDFTDEDQTVIRRTFDIPVRNTEAVTITISANVLGLPSLYNVPTISTATIPPGETKTITVTIEVPHQQSSGRRQIGVVEIRNANTNAQYDTALLLQDTKNMLAIDEISVEYEDLDGETEQENFDGDDSRLELDKNIRPGSPVTITFKDIENLFDRDYDEDSSSLEDITLTIEVDDEDIFKGNFEEEYDLGELTAEEKDDFEVTFEVDEEADEGTYQFNIELTGEDGEGYRHTLKTELKLEVERSRDNLKITKFEISPASPTICDKNVIFSTEIKNIGTRSQSGVTIQLYSPTLEIIQNIPNLNLNRFSKEGHSYSRSFLIDFAAKDLNPGRHDVEFNVFINDDELVDSQRKLLVVGECAGNKSAAGNADAAINALEDSNKENQDNDREEQKLAKKYKAKKSSSNFFSSGKIVQTIEDPYTSEDVLVSLIIISIILLLAVITIFTVIIIKNKSEVSKK